MSQYIKIIETPVLNNSELIHSKNIECLIVLRSKHIASKPQVFTTGGHKKCGDEGCDDISQPIMYIYSKMNVCIDN